MGRDGHTIYLLQFVDKGDYVDTIIAGGISAPVLYEGGVNGAPVDDPTMVSVSLVPALDRTWTLRYSIDPSWLAKPGRQFPVVLDPSMCIGANSSSCDAVIGGSSYDAFIIDRSDIWPGSAWTVTRVGFDDRHVGGFAYNAMRALVQFPTASLPDGAIPYDCHVSMHIDSMYSNPVGRTIYALPITQDWDPSIRWGGFGPYGNGDGFTWSNATNATVTSGATGLDWWPETLCAHQYTQNPNDWLQNFGFAFVMDTEASGAGEVEFSRTNDTSTWKQPEFDINYEIPSTTMGFDPALGTNYSPSMMLAGQSTTLPVVVTNKASLPIFRYVDMPDNHYVFGYRWFNQDNAIVASSTINLPVSLYPGDSTGTFALPVTAPSTPGVYTLRLDLVHDQWGVLDWASDFATGSAYFARQAYSASPQNTRWVGSSAIERDEFSISVVSTTPAGGEWRSVTLGDGGTLAINLWSQDLTYTGDEGVGFSDLLTVGLSYNYHSSATGDPNLGILGANGWSTNFDEKITADPTKVGTYIYQDPSGNRTTLSTNPDGQISGAGVSINRPRVTLLDETGSTPNGSFSEPTFSTNKTFSGKYAFGVPAGSSLNVKPSGFVGADMNAYPTLALAVRTDGAASTALAFKVKNLTDASRNVDGTGRWFVYTFGTPFSTGFTTGVDQVDLNGTINGTDWSFYWVGLTADFVAAGLAGVTDQLQLVDLQTIGSGAAGTVYFDAVRLEGARYDGFNDSAPAGSTGTWTPNTTDVVDGTTSLDVTPADSPNCGSACGFAPLNLAKAAYLSWSWKKIGGGSAAMVVHVYNAATNQSFDLTYYAGTMPAGAANPIQVAETAPEGWVRVTRNVLEDARVVFGWYGHTAAPPSAFVALAGTTTAGLHGPDPVYGTGFAPMAVDGTDLRVDALWYTSIPDHGAPA